MITKLLLSNFRNFKEKIFEFSSDSTAIVGSNGVGKTTILEALSLLSTGKSFKSRKDKEMILEGEEIARVKTRVIEPDGKRDLEIVLTDGFLSTGDSVTKVPKKKFLIDGTSKRSVDFAAIFKTVLFLPEHMDLITASPSIRRNYLDSVLIQIDREYRRSLISYEKGIRSRNRVLQNIREGMGTRADLFFWDKLVIKNGEYITSKREEFVDYLNKNSSLGEKEYKVFFDKSVISESRIEQYQKEEVYAGTTLVGPHRDDIIFFEKNEKFTNGKDLSKYGSRGEQRMSVLWAKSTELNFIEEKTKVRPTLLLDDIFSELDHKHRSIVFDVVKKQQTILTSADPHYLEEFSTIDKIQL